MRYLVFIEANKKNKAMVAYEKALEWQELFMLVTQSEMSDDDTVETAYRVAGEFWEGAESLGQWLAKPRENVTMTRG